MIRQIVTVFIVLTVLVGLGFGGLKISQWLTPPQPQPLIAPVQPLPQPKVVRKVPRVKKLLPVELLERETLKQAVPALKPFLEERPKEEVFALADLDPSRRPRRVIGTLHTETGRGSLSVQDLPFPWLARGSGWAFYGKAGYAIEQPWCSTAIPRADCEQFRTKFLFTLGAEYHFAQIKGVRTGVFLEGSTRPGVYFGFTARW